MVFQWQSEGQTSCCVYKCYQAAVQSTTNWSALKEIYFLTVLVAKSLKSRCQQSHALMKALEEEPGACLPPFLTSGGCWQSLASFSFWKHHSSLCFCFHVTSSLCVCVICVQISVSLWGYQSLDYAHPSSSMTLSELVTSTGILFPISLHSKVLDRHEL